jgi:acetyl esterase/lipase
VGGVTITADIQRPIGGCATPCPVIILVHGGAWRMGSKGDLTTLLARPTKLAPLLGSGYGFVVLVVDYRMACNPLHPPDGVRVELCGYPFPAAEQDVQAAVDWAHKNIATYGGDPNRITMLGFSAGAQIALDIATAGHGLVAVGAWSPPIDFAACANVCPAMTNYVGCSPMTCPSAWAAATAKNFVTPATPPTFIANSTQETIPLAWAQEFSDALRANGVPVEFQTIVGTLHAEQYMTAVLADGRTVLEHTLDFLKRTSRAAR